MTNWNMRTEGLELKDGSTIKNYHYEFNSTDKVIAKIVEDVFKAIMDISTDRKTENSSEKPNNFDKDINVRSKDEPQTCSVNGRPYDCGNCEYHKCTADEPQTETQAETQNSNLTFEKRTMRDCYNCERYETERECIECHYEPKTEPQTKEWHDDCNTCRWHACTIPCCDYEPKTEPQTERSE